MDVTITLLFTLDPAGFLLNLLPDRCWKYIGDGSEYYFAVYFIPSPISENMLETDPTITLLFTIDPAGLLKIYWGRIQPLFYVEF